MRVGSVQWRRVSAFATFCAYQDGFQAVVPTLPFAKISPQTCTCLNNFRRTMPARCSSSNPEATIWLVNSVHAITSSLKGDASQLLTRTGRLHHLCDRCASVDRRPHVLTSLQDVAGGDKLPRKGGPGISQVRWSPTALSRLIRTPVRLADHQQGTYTPNGRYHD
jgi:hypothetical protein